MAFSAYLKKVRDGGDLSVAETESAFSLIFDQKVAEVDMVLFLKALSDKGETALELSGLLNLLKAHMKLVDLGTDDFIDTCGTGGSGRADRFNLSTAASLIAASCGAKIAKHGNRGASSKSGSADFLEALGYPLDESGEALQERLAKTGFCFFFAPLFHPSMKTVASARRAVKQKTIFNCVGPLLNPARAKRQVIGVYSERVGRLMAEVLAKDLAHEALIVHGKDGLDEVTLADTSALLRVKDGKIESSILDPRDYGFSLCKPEDLAGGSAEENAKRFVEICEGRDHSPLKDALVLNAALILAFYRREVLSGGHIGEINDGLKRVPSAIKPRS